MAKASGEAGSSLIETIIALAIMGFIGVGFLSALATTSHSRLIADEHVTARILAESQIENIRTLPYSFSYDPIAIPAEYVGYAAAIEIDNMRNGNIQKIIITVSHHTREIETFETYKVNR